MFPLYSDTVQAILYQLYSKQEDIKASEAMDTPYKKDKTKKTIDLLLSHQTEGVSITMV